MNYSIGKYRSFGFSFLIILASIFLLLLFIRPAINQQGYGISLFVIGMAVHYIALVSGAILLLFRFLKIIKNRSAFYYNFTGSLNFCIGLLYITLYAFHKIDATFIMLFYVNIFLGLLIFIDILLD